MLITEYEKEKLFLYMAGEVAKKRLKKKIKLNYPECIALISCDAMERARKGDSIKKIVEKAKKTLTFDQVMEGIPEMLDEILIEATFPDGTKLITIKNPIEKKSQKIPGQYKLKKQEINILPEKKRIIRKVKNIGKKPIQIGSHYHFYEVNEHLLFERKGTFGYRLDIPSGTSIRINFNEEKKVNLIEIGGFKKIYGFSKK